MDTCLLKAECEKTKRFLVEQKHTFRSEFQRDRDRILYSKEFRRLSGKTQVFISGFDDNMRTRLTHTLEVAQISNTIARALGLNETLVEAIAYGHDVGHTPFGHVGERTLNLIMNGCKNIYKFNVDLPIGEKGFKHNLQGYRVVTELEELYDNCPGLNLTPFTLWGILNHSETKYKECEFFSKTKKCRLQNRDSECKIKGEFYLDFYEFKDLNEKEDWTFEAAIVSVADEIAQRHHDLEDGIYAGVIDKSELIKVLKNVFLDSFTESEKSLLKELENCSNKNKSGVIALVSKLIVNFYVTNYINFLKKRLKDIIEEHSIICSDDFYTRKEEIYNYLTQCDSAQNIIDALGFDSSFEIQDKKFQKFLTSRILNSEIAQSMDGKADYIIRKLFKAYLSNPQQLPDKTIKTICLNHTLRKGNQSETEDYRNYLKDKLNSSDEHIQTTVLRVVCDYIAGMTDNYAIDQLEKLYGSQKYKNY